MKYNVIINDGFGIISFESNSRNAMKHAREYGAITCTVYTKSGKPISQVMYSDEFGYYYVVVNRG